MYLFTTVPHPHGHWQLQELLGNQGHPENYLFSLSKKIFSRSKYRSVGNIRACYDTLRLHMPTDYGVTSKKFGYVTLRKDIICPRRSEKNSRYVTQRRHMPTSIFCAVTRCCFSFAEAIMQTLLDAFSAANLTLLASSIYVIRSSSASVQSLRDFMNLNSEQLSLAANFWWPTFGGQLLVANFC